MPKKILEIKNLKKVYHTDKEEVIAVDNVSFDLYDGEILAIVGPSGCGKSTILSIIGGLENKSSGDILKKETVNLVIMDVGLPGMNGIDASKRIKNEYSDIIINQICFI